MALQRPTYGELAPLRYIPVCDFEEFIQCGWVNNVIAVIV